MKRTIFTLFALLLVATCFAQSSAANDFTQTVRNNGIGLGSAIAVVASWDRNKSILWAIIHGILGWLYVIYYAITRP
ncbi:MULTISPECIES: hypothetical protein [Sphingobacterium]|uniref:Uncharacterized protein n=1 Tax=Sphingobacterium thermophilum TaxID=768534 RepID=A0ABP8QWM0_9SPHI|nr:hypothetical protein [Sphingobacterium sp. T2]